MSGKSRSTPVIETQFRVYIDVVEMKHKSAFAVARSTLQDVVIANSRNIFPAGDLPILKDEELPGYYKRKECDDEFTVVVGTQEKVPVKRYVWSYTYYDLTAEQNHNFLTVPEDYQTKQVEVRYEVVTRRKVKDVV